MCIEIEAKLKVESLEDVKRKLVGLGAKFLAEQHQMDYYFDSSDRTLTKGDRCLRLRREMVGDSERFFLTYKGAKEKDHFKKRKEINIEINNLNSAEELLSVLGYSRVLAVEKNRRVWRLMDCIVALDQLPLLGTFVEIEGPEDENIVEAQKELGLASLLHIAESYASLMEQKLHELGKNKIRAQVHKSTSAQGKDRRNE